MSTSAHGQAVYGNTSSQVAGANGAIQQNPIGGSPTMSPPTTMAGGRRSRRNNSRRNQNGNSRRNQNGNSRRQRNNSRRNQDGGRNNSRRNQNGNSRRQRQRGGK